MIQFEFSAKFSLQVYYIIKSLKSNDLEALLFINFSH